MAKAAGRPEPVKFDSKKVVQEEEEEEDEDEIPDMCEHVWHERWVTEWVSA